jgi:superfamily II DNA or RNA helicase|tara:strand:+ start:10893 stop:12521 length:1629 start_codon:yes stop_codon:yes gene_type:complete
MQQLLFDGFSQPNRSGKPGQVNYFCERPYQTEARETIEDSFRKHDSVLVEIATGLGKTEIFTQLIKDWDKGRCLVVAPYIQLIGQASKKIFQRTGEQPGVEQAKHWSVETPWGRSKYIVGSKDTLLAGEPKRYERIRDVGLLVIDEAHLSITKGWKELIDYYRNNGAKVLGVTATAKRHDKKSMANIYDDCVYQYGITDAVPDGWLVPALTDCIQLESLDLSEVSSTGTVFGRDFNRHELNGLLERWETIFEIADITARETKDSKTVVYCSSVAEAKMVAERLVDSYGIKADWIASDTSRCTPQRRREVLQSFQEDRDGLTHVCNVGILTTGWDYPALECIVMARPTKSKALYTQIFGRGTRPLAGVVDFDGSDAEARKQAIANSKKPHFRMIDLVDASLAHKIITSVDVMGGHLGEEVVNRAREIILKDEGLQEIDEALAEANKALAIEREEEERNERARVEAIANYRKIRVEHVGSAQAGVRKKKRGARMLFGKFKGMLVEDIPTWYLEGCASGKPYIAHKWLSSAIRKEVDKRRKMGGV